ncbi:MAG: monovalent cation:proton antiporter-2 (CPA2) family protein [Janthinobacterium lividum]
MLFTLAMLLAAAVLLVPVSRRLGLGSVLGYLVGGALIGPSALGLITDVQAIADVSELGVIMLLFLIGLEVRPRRLWVMRRAVFGLGSAQVVITGAALALCVHGFGAGWASAAVIGAGLALSSTAIVLPMLTESGLLGLPSGRSTFAVLLFQDLAFVPLVAVVPLLAGSGLPHTVSLEGLPWLAVARAAGAIAVILVGGRFLMRPVFRAIGGTKTPEVFTALALLVVVGTAALAHAAGLSTSLGAFLAGVLLSESEYRHEVKANVDPFEGLLLGFFFLSVGMAANLGLAWREPGLFTVAVLGFVVVKTAVAFGLARLGRLDTVSALRFSLSLSQGSEFSFVLFGAAVAAGVMVQGDSERATLLIALSMAATPVLFALSERFLVPRLQPPSQRVFEPIEDEGTPVIICGFGRVGQIVGRTLRMREIAFTALEQDPEQLDVVRRFGQRVFYGDPTRLEVLRAAGADHAKLLVVTLADMEASLAVIDVARRNFPNLKIVARARNRRHVHLMMDRGIDRFVRETFLSSLALSEMVLQDIGIAPDDVRRTVELFREYDERSLRDSHAYYTDEKQLIQNGRQTADELAGLLEADRQRQLQS